MKGKLNFARPALFLAITLSTIGSRFAAAATYQWLGLTNGDLASVGTNYEPIGSPGGSDVVEFNAAGFYDNFPITNVPLMLGGLWFGSESANGISVGGLSTLTLNSTTVNSNPNTALEVDPGAGSSLL